MIIQQNRLVESNRSNSSASNIDLSTVGKREWAVTFLFFDDKRLCLLWAVVVVAVAFLLFFL
jgi:hypothetical protein